MQLPIFEWYVTRPVVKKENKKETLYDEIGLCDQNKSTVLGSIVTTTGRAYLIA